MPKELECDRQYPHPVDEAALKAILYVRGPRAAKVKFRTKKTLTAIWDDNFNVKLHELPPGEYTFHGSNILPGGEWYNKGRLRDWDKVTSDVIPWAKGKDIIQLTEMPRYKDGYWNVWIDVKDLEHVEVIDGLWDVPGVEEQNDKMYWERRAELREYIKKFILAKDAKFHKHTETEIAKKTRPLRHPNGKAHTKHDRDYFWSDAVWCGDISGDPLIEFFNIENGDIFEFFSGKVGDDYSFLWDEVFRETLPDMVHVLEG